nr:MAG TPA: hypothetical protein [Caudoviricetes sp.]DAO71835.1 MAG TPA: hypothetical protein [Caudoviricetes sp.]
MCEKNSGSAWLLCALSRGLSLQWCWTILTKFF